ncbi:MAG: hypothetical protein LBU79_01145 [Planctomycetota bacterium]|nr:hypothetical protein [Planctomycetota bacterium]
MAVNILPRLKAGDSYSVQPGIEPSRIASVGSCFIARLDHASAPVG